MATLKEVARLAGVSESTASRILTGSRHKSARFGGDTRERVLRAAKSLSYQPNLAARTLAKGRSGIIALVFPRVVDSPFSALFVAELIAAVESRCRECGLHLLVSSPYLTENGPDPTYPKLLRGGYLDGIIAIDEFLVSSVLGPAVEAGIPTVICGSRDYYNVVRGNDEAGAQLLIDHLCKNGHSRFGFITVPETFHYSGIYRTRAFRKALWSAALDFDAMPRVHGDFSKESGARAAKLLLDSSPDVTAVVAFNDRMALGALSELRRRGIEVPAEISVTGYDDLLVAAESNPPLTTVDQNVEALGKTSVNHLLRVMEGEVTGTTLIEPELRARASSGKARAW